MRKLFATSLQRRSSYCHEGHGASWTYVSNSNFNSIRFIGRRYIAHRTYFESGKLSRGVLHHIYASKLCFPAFPIRALSTTTVHDDTTNNNQNDPATNQKHKQSTTFHEPNINIKQILSPSKTIEYHVKTNKKNNNQQLVQNVPPSSLFARMVSSYFDLVSYFLPKGYPSSTGLGYPQHITMMYVYNAPLRSTDTNLRHI